MPTFPSGVVYNNKGQAYGVLCCPPTVEGFREAWNQSDSAERAAIRIIWELGKIQGWHPFPTTNAFFVEEGLAPLIAMAWQPNLAWIHASTVGYLGNRILDLMTKYNPGDEGVFGNGYGPGEALWGRWNEDPIFWIIPPNPEDEWEDIPPPGAAPPDEITPPDSLVPSSPLSDPKLLLIGAGIVAGIFLLPRGR